MLKPRTIVVPIVALPVMAVCVGACVGCVNTPPTTQPSDMHSRQDKALKDPFGVGGVEQTQEKYDVSGGGLGEFDRKSFKKDVDSVFGP